MKVKSFSNNHKNPHDNGGIRDDTLWEDLTNKEQRAWISADKKPDEWCGFWVYVGDVFN